MAVKAKQKQTTDFVKKLYVGFTSVKVVAINPNREELNKLIGKDNSPDDKPIEYGGTDKEGNDRVRILFVLKDDKNDEMFFYSFNMTNKVRRNKEGDKCQVINCVCSTSWAPLIKKGDTPTDKVNESLLQEWFVNFTDENKKIIGPKKWRKALAGEEELAILMRTWLGRAEFKDPETEILVDTKKLFKQDFKELRELISLDSEGKFSADGLDAPFVILLGIRTDEEDTNKKYQQVWEKGFLPNSYMKYINNGLKFPTDPTKKVWDKFEKEVTGDYGFKGFTELVPLREYDPVKDPTAGAKTGSEVPEEDTSDYR